MMIAMKRAETLMPRHLQSQLAGNLLYREVAQLFNFIFFHLSNIILPVSTLFAKILPVSSIKILPVSISIAKILPVSISIVKFLPVSTLFSKILPVSISTIKFYQFPDLEFIPPRKNIFQKIPGGKKLLFLSHRYSLQVFLCLRVKSRLVREGDEFAEHPLSELSFRAVFRFT